MLKMSEKLYFFLLLGFRLEIFSASSKNKTLPVVERIQRERKSRLMEITAGRVRKREKAGNYYEHIKRTKRPIIEIPLNCSYYTPPPTALALIVLF